MSSVTSDLISPKGGAVWTDPKEPTMTARTYALDRSTDLTTIMTSSTRIRAHTRRHTRLRPPQNSRSTLSSETLLKSSIHGRLDNGFGFRFLNNMLINDGYDNQKGFIEASLIIIPPAVDILKRNSESRQQTIRRKVGAGIPRIMC
jgi:hypothetical protein